VLKPWSETKYVPEHFEENRTEVLHALMRSHPLAALVTLGTPGPAPSKTLPGC
jgi:predicted FMN-binding regulatory protein PaiB